MFARLVFACAGIVLLPTITVAQEAPANPPAAAPAADRPLTLAEFDAKAKRLEESLTKRIEESVAQALREQNSRINRLEEKMEQLANFHQGQQQVLEQIAKKDSSGKSYLRIDASHEPTRNELHRAIIESAPKKGKVIIRNKMNTDEPVAINGKTYDVLAKSEREVTVDYGSFCVKLRGQARQTRNFNYPNTETVISVVPQTAQWVSGSPGYWTYVSQ